MKQQDQPTHDNGDQVAKLPIKISHQSAKHDRSHHKAPGAKSATVETPAHEPEVGDELSNERPPTAVPVHASKQPPHGSVKHPDASTPEPEAGDAEGASQADQAEVTDTIIEDDADTDEASSAMETQFQDSPAWEQSAAAELPVNKTAKFNYLMLVLIGLGVVVAAIIAIVLLRRPEAEEVTNSAPAAKQEATKPPPPSLQFIDQTGGVVSLSAFELAKAKLTQSAVNLPQPLYAVSAPHEGAAQWSRDGAYILLGLGQGDGLEAPPPKTFQLQLVGKKVTKTIVKDEEPYRFASWLLAPSGKFVLYMQSNAASAEAASTAKYSLMVYDVASGQSKALLSDLDAARGNARIFLSANETVINMLRFQSRDLYRYSYNLTTGQSEDKKIYTKPSVNLFAGDVRRDMLSPDGSQAILEVQESRNWKLKLLDMSTGKLSDLITIGIDRSSNNVYWSPGGKTISYVTTVFGAGSPDGKKVELAKLDIASKQKTALLQYTVEAGTSGLESFGWSPDGKYLFVRAGHKLELITVADASRQVIREGAGQVNLAGRGWVGF